MAAVLPEFSAQPAAPNASKHAAHTHKQPPSRRGLEIAASVVIDDQRVGIGLVQQVVDAAVQQQLGTVEAKFTAQARIENGIAWRCVVVEVVDPGFAFQTRFQPGLDRFGKASLLLASNSAASKLCAPLRSLTPISPCVLLEGFSAKFGPGAPPGR